MKFLIAAFVAMARAMWSLFPKMRINFAPNVFPSLSPAPGPTDRGPTLLSRAGMTTRMAEAIDHLFGAAPTVMLTGLNMRRPNAGGYYYETAWPSTRDPTDATGGSGGNKTDTRRPTRETMHLIAAGSLSPG